LFSAVLKILILNVGHAILKPIIPTQMDSPTPITYTVQEDDGENVFLLNPVSGEFLLSRSLDFEAQRFYILTVEVQQGHSQVSSVRVYFNALDVNDNPPVFSQNNFTASLLEDTRIRTCFLSLNVSDKDDEIFVLQVFATDTDIEQNSEVVYVVEPPNELFWVDASSGDVFSKQPLLLHNSTFEIYNFTIVAFDCGSIPLHSNTTVIVRLEQLNVHPPNDYIKYNVSGGNASDFFWIQADNGKLFLSQTLEESQNESLTLLVVAKDQGFPPMISETEITFEITGKNHFSPRFSEPEVTFSVPEDLPVGSVAGKIQAEDGDYGPNGVIKYLISPENQYFPVSVGEFSGLLTLTRELDFEKETRYNLQIKATDGGWIAKSAWMNVTLIVMDVNDNPPVFLLSDFSFSVYKNAPVGTSIGKVTATDKDSGPEGEVLYLTFGHGKNFGFDIGPLSGEIYTSRSLRDQGNSKVILKVLAKNSGVIHGTDIAETLVNINVIETNDAPLFTSTWYEADVNEDTPTGTSVLTLSALDQDSVLDWNRFIFRIVDGNTNSSFSIDPLSGIVLVNSDLDRERWPVYNLTVTATDHGSPPATGTTNVIVNIVDVNDNAPQLMTNEIQVKENQPEGTIVARLNAFDFDLPPNQGPFTFWLSNLSAESAFYLTPDGVLLTRHVVDREHISEYRLLVVVKDAGFPLSLSSTTTLHVRVEDENDNPPLPRNIFIEVKYFGINIEKWIDKPTNNIFLKTSATVLNY
uniref:Cadherin domain-containing protein n=1 Tax=Poecilia reticulata TaxID=8081 RepID=A0A3P9P7E5_POERE